MRIDLNADLAEGCGNDEALLQYVSSANIACGLHAGGAVEMARALRVAAANGVCVGAHPGYPDRENFGRIAQNLPADELRAHLLYQLGAAQALCRAAGVKMAYVKPHGALYNQAAKDRVLADVLVSAVRDFDADLKLMALSGSLMIEAAQAAGMETVSEVFADRRYMPDGTLVPRSRDDAQISDDDEAIAQVLHMAKHGSVRAVDGSLVAVRADSVCLHGDGGHALAFAAQIRAVLAAEGIAVGAA